MSANQLSQVATPLAALAERARSAGYDPWLFHRDGWDWCWRSWRAVADHVARSAAVLRDVLAAPHCVGCDARQHPDAITAGLAIRAAGWRAVPVRGGPDEASSRGCSAWAAVGATAEPRADPSFECVLLPPVASPFERGRPQMLELDAESMVGAVAVSDRGAATEERKRSELSPQDLAAVARRVDQRLPATGGRAIVIASPGLDPDVALRLEAWTLVRGAAWLLEPEEAAFIETVLWARPTVVWARASELEMLAARLGVGKHRRRSRLSAVVSVGDDEIDPSPWNGLEVKVVRLDQGRS